MTTDYINHELSQTTKYLSVAVVVLVFVVGYLAASDALQPKGRLSCGSFGSYSDIPSNWKKTMPWLDGNGDDIPCNALYKISLKQF